MRFVFLDRDGVINRFPGKGKYVTVLRDLVVSKQSMEGIRLLSEAGYYLAVISNQGCVSRGLLTRKGLSRITRILLSRVRRHGGKIQKVLYCTHQTTDRCACKKPKIKLLEQAVRGRKIVRRDIYFIGDSDEDMRAGKKFGCRTLLVLSGRTKKKNIPRLSVKPDKVKRNLLEAAQWILKKKS